MNETWRQRSRLWWARSLSVARSTIVLPHLRRERGSCWSCLSTVPVPIDSTSPMGLGTKLGSSLGSLNNLLASYIANSAGLLATKPSVFCHLISPLLPLLSSITLSLSLSLSLSTLPPSTNLYSISIKEKRSSWGGPCGFPNFPVFAWSSVIVYPMHLK